MQGDASANVKQVARFAMSGGTEVPIRIDADIAIMTPNLMTTASVLFTSYK